MNIVITGPESVGKSTLAMQLSHFFKGIYVPEYARAYVEVLNRPYDFEDIENIAKQQVQEYQKQQNNKDICFLDTFLIVTKVWFLHCYKRIPSWFNEAMEQSPIDLYLLCVPDLDAGCNFFCH